MGQILGESHGFYENRREDQPLLTATNEGGIIMKGRKFLKRWAPRYVFCITTRKMSLYKGIKDDIISRSKRFKDDIISCFLGRF